MATHQRDSSVASTSRSPTQDDNKMKVSKPDAFYGDRYKLENWINQILLYFYLENIPSNKQSLIAASYLRGGAQQWISPMLTARLIHNRDPAGIFGSFATFVEAIRGIYGLSNDQQVATRHVQHIIQKGSASQYTAKFKEYAAKTGWDDAALRSMYYRGLKDKVKDGLMHYGAATDTIEQLAKAAIEVDDKIYEREMEKRHTGQIRGRSGYASNGWTGGQQRRDPDAMELDATQGRPRKGQGKGKGAKGKGQAQGKKREGLKCYNCQRIGHYARDCRSGKVRPQQSRAAYQPMEVNMMEHRDRSLIEGPGTDDDYDESIWDFVDERFEGNTFRELASDDSVRTTKNAIVSMTALAMELNPDLETAFLEQRERLIAYAETLEEGQIGQLHQSVLNQEKAYLVQERERKEREEHATLHWSFCYNDSCSRHYRSKMDRGWFPQRPRKELNATLGWGNLPTSPARQPLQQARDDGNIARGRSPPPYRWEDATLQENIPPQDEDQDEYEEEEPETINIQELGVIPEIPESTQGEATPEDSEEEYTDDDEPDDNEILNFSVDGPEPIKRMVLHIVQRYEEIFPRIQGKRRLNPRGFDEALLGLRSMFWKYRRVYTNFTEYAHVREIVPIGSRFNPDGSYFTPDGKFIPRQMRERIRLIDLRYREFYRIQDAWQDDEMSEQELKAKSKEEIESWVILPRTPPGTPEPTTTRQLLPRTRAIISGHINVEQQGSHVVLTPKTGPLNWKVSLVQTTGTAKNY